MERRIALKEMVWEKNHMEWLPAAVRLLTNVAARQVFAPNSI